MGFRRCLMLAAAPLLPGALSAAAQAQQAEQPAPTFSLPPASTAPAPNPNRQGPELDVYRDSPATPGAPPPAVTPTVTPPPATVQPAPQTAPTRPAPEQPRATRPVERPTDTPAPAAPANQSEAAPAPAAAPVEAPPAPAANAAEPSPTTPQPAPENAPQAGILPWIVGGALALLALAGLLLLRRRRVDDSQPDPRPAPEATAPPTAPPPPAPAAAPPPPAPEPATDRPWLDMDMAVTQARFSLVGVTIAYSLILHNRGETAAQDIMVRGVIGNAGAQQQALLQGFFGGDDGMPLHHSVAINPGETRVLAGELRLAADAIQPVQMGQRSLLIPIAAFDAAYRWGGEGDDPAGQGRTARAFIVGQEQEPPTDRLAPLRLDQGPRQYRRPAARAAVELTPA